MDVIIGEGEVIYNHRLGHSWLTRVCWSTLPEAGFNTFNFQSGVAVGRNETAFTCDFLE